MVLRRIRAVEGIFDEPGVWGAIQRVADTLVAKGRLRGWEIEALLDPIGSP